MELKEYQTRALDAFVRWRDVLDSKQAEMEIAKTVLQRHGQDVSVDALHDNYPKLAWKELADAGEVADSAKSYVERTSDSGDPIPHVCFKVPTGGGKTLLAAAAVERLNRPTGLVLWMVPSKAIYRQTKQALWNREHPYRHMLERASGGRVKMLEKGDPFTAADVEHYLCVMLISLQSANHRTRDYLRMFRDSGHYMSFFPDDDDVLGNARLRCRFPDLEPLNDQRPVKQSLFNVFKMQRPVIVLDEAHKAYGVRGEDNEEFVRSINRLNPRLVIELSATPSRSKSNLLVDISGVDLKSEEMIKLPVRIRAFTDVEWQHTLGEAHAQLEALDNESVSLDHQEGRYIRPIAVVRVEHTGKAQVGRDTVHAEDARAYLTQNLGVPAAAVRVKSSENDELGVEALLDKTSPVRWIITRDALKEGWDCPFAYLLVLLDNTRAKTAITQLVGRVMRQPEARQTGRDALDQCYVYCQNTDVNAAVKHVKKGLEQEGLEGLEPDILRNDDPGHGRKDRILRRERFRGRIIFLPKVLHKDSREGWVELDYRRHIASSLKWTDIGPPPNMQIGMAQEPQEARASVDLTMTDAPAVYDAPRSVRSDTDVEISWYARRLSHVMPNPFQAAHIAQQMVQQMRNAGFDSDAINAQRSSLAAQLCRHVKEEVDRLAEQIFRTKLAKGQIRFNLETDDQNYRMRECYDIQIDEGDHSLERYGQPLQLSLFERLLEKDYNDLERRFAFYLDQQKALQWWHRVAARQHGEYYLRGWRHERIWPDFVAMACETDSKSSVLVFDTKGDHLKDNDDTEYKRKVFDALLWFGHIWRPEPVCRSGPGAAFRDRPAPLREEVRAATGVPAGCGGRRPGNWGRFDPRPTRWQFVCVFPLRGCGP